MVREHLERGVGPRIEPYAGAKCIIWHVGELVNLVY